MKTSRIIAATIGLGLTSAFAGPVGGPAKGPLAPPAPAPAPYCTAFDGDKLELGLYGSYYFGSNDLVDDNGAIGISAAYFFTEFIGIQASYSLVFSSPELHDLAGSVVARYPIKDICLAPYVYGGGGYADNTTGQATGHIGTGLDWRFDDNHGMGVFVDYRYTFADKTADWQAVSAGFKINF